MTGFKTRLRSPALNFLVNNVIVTTLNDRLTVPSTVCGFVIFVLLVGINVANNVNVHGTGLARVLLPTLFTIIANVIVILVKHCAFTGFPNVQIISTMTATNLFNTIDNSAVITNVAVLRNRNVRFRT